MTASAADPNDSTVQAVVAKISTELGKFIDDIGDTTPTVEELTENPNLQQLAHSMSEQVAGILMAGHDTLSLGGEAGGVTMAGHGTLGLSGKVGGAPTMAGYGILSLGGKVGGGRTAGVNGRLELSSGDVADVHGTMDVILEGVVAQITATAHPGKVSAGEGIAEPGPMFLWAAIYFGLQQYIADRLLHETLAELYEDLGLDAAGGA